MSNSPVKIIAIDGPSASGKSTVARRVARAMGFNYVDSGSFYRGLTWNALRENVEVRDAAAVVEMLGRIQFSFQLSDYVVTFSINEVEPGDEIRSAPVQERVSDVASIPEVRTFLVARLRETARFGSLVMEGRDIGTVVFPDTPYKFYLDANPEERARRRHAELANHEEYRDVGKVMSSLARRDQKDATRRTAPLQIALGADVIDSTHLQIEDVVAHILKKIKPED